MITTYARILISREYITDLNGKSATQNDTLDIELW